MNLTILSGTSVEMCCKNSKSQKSLFWMQLNGHSVWNIYNFRHVVKLKTLLGGPNLNMLQEFKGKWQGYRIMGITS